MPSRLLTIEQVLTLLAETPPRLQALTADLAPAQLRSAPNDEWSASDVLAHLRACADVWGGCIATILAEERPTLRAVNPRSWITQTDYRELEFQPSLRTFAAQRAALLAVLEPLPPAGWSRTATVTGVGKTLERTVMFYARWLAEHERPHVKQIARLVTTMRTGQCPPSLIMTAEAQTGQIDDRCGFDLESHERSPLDASKSRAKSQRRTRSPGS